MLLSPAILHSASLLLAAILTTNLEELLRRSDVGALAPDSFRARLALKSESPAARHEIEIWRSGEGKTLIRFLDSKERGKYLLRLQDQLWLLAPGARKPIHQRKVLLPPRRGFDLANCEVKARSSATVN